MTKLHDAALRAFNVLSWIADYSDCPSSCEDAVKELKAALAQEPAQPEHESVNVDGVFPEWKPGDSDFKHWCYQHFGPDADEAYLAEAVLLLPRNQKLPLKAADEFELHRLLAEERYTVRQLSRALREEIEQPTFMGEPHPPSRHCMCAYCKPSFDDAAVHPDLAPQPAVQEPNMHTRNITKIERPSDQTLTLHFTSCAQASKFAEALAQEPAPQPKRLTDEQIEQCVQQAVAARKLSWQGFKLDAQGLYTVPVVSQTHFQLARAIEAAVLGEMP